MVTEDLYRFEHLSEKLGNRYLAVRFISSSARSLGVEKKEYHIAESKLIQWILTGHCPYTEKQLQSRRAVSDDDGVDDFLSWVSDQDIVDEVKSLYKSSVKMHSIVYCKNNKFNQGQIDRINILLRMIWYSICK